MPRPIRAAYTIPWGAQFGANRANGRRKHQGTDYHCPVGTPIYGTGPDGRVSSIGFNGSPVAGFGHYIQVVYPNGRATLDAHMRARTTLNVGEPVGETTILGYVGLTGNAINADPPGSHDHHQMTLYGSLRDPEAYYRGTTTTPAGGPLTPITEDEDMPLTDQDIGKLLNYPAFTGGPSLSAVLKEVHSLYGAVFSGGPDLPDNGRAITDSLAGIVALLDTEFKPVQRPFGNVPVRQDNADTNTMVRKLVDRFAPEKR